MLDKYHLRNVSNRFKAYKLLLQERRNWHQFVFNKRHDLGIGLNAINFNSAFRLDGSMKYPDNKQSSFSSVAEYKDDAIDSQ